jgi:hypothetical protein
MTKSIVLGLLPFLMAVCCAFQTPWRTTTTTTTSRSTTALFAKSGVENSDDFMRWAKASRSAQAEDNVVELVRPLGLVLNQDERGNVYVETVAPRGNAARTGKVCLYTTYYIKTWYVDSSVVHLLRCVFNSLYIIHTTHHHDDRSRRVIM